MDNLTTEAKGTKAKVDNLTTEVKGSKTQADNLTTEAKGGKAKADNLTTEEKGGNTKTEEITKQRQENRNRSEAATREGTIEITTKKTTMITGQGGEYPFTLGREIPRDEVKMIVSQKTETGIQTSMTGHGSEEQWENYWRSANWGKRYYREEKQGLLGYEIKKKSTVVQNRRRQNDPRRRCES